MCPPMSTQSCVTVQGLLLQPSWKGQQGTRAVQSSCGVQSRGGSRKGVLETMKFYKYSSRDDSKSPLICLDLMTHTRDEL